MDLTKFIYERKSCRKYIDEEIEEETLKEIEDFISGAKLLDEGCEFYYEILRLDEVKVQTGWNAPYYLALYSKKCENSLENIGFVFQQVSLFIQSLNLGSCWVARGTVKKDNPDFVILISFGKSDDITRGRDEFKRKSLSKISDSSDECLLPAQLAPSAINSQPWYFKKTENGFDVYQVKQNIIKRKFLKDLNRIDMGIVLSHLYLSNEESFEFEFKQNKQLKGYEYKGTVKI
ncbi:nitroreductase family protein [uncultured Methanobrevibacter sp.]|uniref:nitroreductase family protein n=1 Tax=uncultured Methanobrevibacter sp. TaxID=253161 RepID=UPI00263814AE